MTDLTLPLFWGYIKQGNTMIIKKYENSKQISDCQALPTTIDVICPFRARNIPEAQAIITNNYHNLQVVAE